jgi:hypothetical protein
MSWKAGITIGLCVFIGTCILLAQQPVAQGPQASNASVWLQNLTQVATTNLGSPTAWGSAPSGNVIGVNANVLSNVPPTPQSSSTYAFGNDFHGQTSTTTYNTVKSSGGNLYGWAFTNSGATPCWIVFYNSSSPTIGTTAVVERFMVQAGVSVIMPAGAFGLTNYSTAITFAATTTEGGSTVCSTALEANVYAQ